MTERRVDYLLVGGGMASAYCAAELRRRGAEGSILLVGREPEPPYERPPLTKDYLRGESEREQAFVHAEDWYRDNEVELRTRTNVMSLDSESRRAVLQGGEEVVFDKALLATGAMVNLLRVEGAQLDGIFYLRAFGNADSIRERVAEAERIVLIGGSYIGCEVAASLTAMGKSCAVVMLEEVALSRTFGEQVGRYFDDLLGAKGVELHRGETLKAFEGSERVEAVLTESGRRIEADLVVIGAGVRPDQMLAQRGGLEVGDGIICDTRLESSVPGIYAAGDCCSYESVIHGRRLRLEHWDVALNQGRHAAANMLGDDKPYEVVPYFFSDLADWASLEYIGPAHEWDQVVMRGEPGDEEGFLAWYLAQGRVAGALSVGRSTDLGEARRLLADRVTVAGRESELADPGSDLSEIA
jgi:3-phenylpropionate/trans-cinnamate dioxygenase ferredoxin reductase subunit